MIITLKIDLSKSGNLLHELMNNEGVEIIETRSNQDLVIVVGSCGATLPVRNGIINETERLMREREDPLLIDFKNRCDVINNFFDDPKPLASEIGDIDIFHYSGYKSSWFIHILSLTSKKARFRYLVSILKWMSRIYYQALSKPFIRQLFYRKCFMVLKDFRNIRRCYNF